MASYAEQHFSDEILSGFSLTELSERLKLPRHEIYRTVCASCNTTYTPVTDKHDYFCTSCGHHTTLLEHKEYISCPSCKSIIKHALNTSRCPTCSSTKTIRKIHFSSLLGLDHILISPRHLYRIPYSLHEKSGLVSLPINPDSVLTFEKEHANPANIAVDMSFLRVPDILGEGSDFVQLAFDSQPEITKNDVTKYHSRAPIVEDDGAREKIPEECFPPSIRKILLGLKDGKKRALFVLVNFLTSVGWSYPEIEERIAQWNSQNADPLRETIIKSHITYHKTQKKEVLPPNYSSAMYYADLGVCAPEEMSGKFKNPVSYAKRLFLVHKQNHKTKKSRVKDTNDKNAVTPAVSKEQQQDL